MSYRAPPSAKRSVPSSEQLTAHVLRAQPFTHLQGAFSLGPPSFFSNPPPPVPNQLAQVPLRTTQKAVK